MLRTKGIEKQLRVPSCDKKIKGERFAQLHSDIRYLFHNNNIMRINEYSSS